MNCRGAERGMEDCYGSVSQGQVIALHTPLTDTCQMAMAKLPHPLHPSSCEVNLRFSEPGELRKEGRKSAFHIACPSSGETDVEDNSSSKDCGMEGGNESLGKFSFFACSNGLSGKKIMSCWYPCIWVEDTRLILFGLHRGAPRKGWPSATISTDFPLMHYSETLTARHNQNVKNTHRVIFINCVNCDSIKEQYIEAVTELKVRRLINKLLFEKINKIEAFDVTYTC